MRPLVDTILNNVDASTSSNSAAVDTRFVLAASLQAVVTGSAVGTLKLQASNDNISLPYQPTNFVDIPSATVSITGAGVFLIPKLDVAYQFVRAVFTSTSGTGTITANLKTIGF